MKQNRSKYRRSYAKHVLSLACGGWALQLANHKPRLAACVVKFGLPTNPAHINKINAAVLAIFGPRKRGVSPDKNSRVQKLYDGCLGRVDIEVHAGAGRGFENPANQTVYRLAARGAWPCKLGLFKRAKQSGSSWLTRFRDGVSSGLRKRDAPQRGKVAFQTETNVP